MKNHNYYFKDLIGDLKNNLDYSNKSPQNVGLGSFQSGFANIYSIFADSVDFINKECDEKLISIERLSTDLFRLILDYDELDWCFYLLSRDKYVFIFSENSQQISFFGKYKRQKEQQTTFNRNFVQLFKLNPHLEKGEVIYKDNTGNKVDPNEISYHVLKWILVR